MDELRPGLWRWTSAHPDWEPDPEPESPADWPREVGSVAYAAPGAFVLIDPLVGSEETWERLDELARAHGRPVHVLTTLPFHARSAADARRRFAAAGGVPPGVEPIELERAGETMFWLPEPRVLVPGDRLLGDGRGGLRTCPESWLAYLANGLTGGELRATLRERLAGLPVELVLVPHGEPVLERGREALDRALSADL